MDRLVDGAGDAHRRGREQEGRRACAHPHERAVEWGTAAHGHEKRLRAARPERAMQDAVRLTRPLLGGRRILKGFDAPDALYAVARP